MAAPKMATSSRARAMVVPRLTGPLPSLAGRLETDEVARRQG